MSLVGKLKIGTEVTVHTNDVQGKKGVVRYVGNIDTKEGEFIGVELDGPYGKNNGDFAGKSYFTVDKKQKKGSYGVFVPPKTVKLINGTVVLELLNAKIPTKAEKPVSKMQRKGSSSNIHSKNKLSLQMEESNETQLLQEQLDIAQQRIKELLATDANKLIDELKQKLKESQEKERQLRINLQKVKYSVDAGGQEKYKELADQMAFFKTQKTNADKENAELKKKISSLKAELQEGADREEMMGKMILQIQDLQSKCEKYKQQTQGLKIECKNNKMLAGNISNEQLSEDLKVLNEMVTVLEGEINQQKTKNKVLQQELQINQAKLQQFPKMQRKVKKMMEEIQLLKTQVDGNSEAVSFAQKLTLDMIKKEEGFKQKSLKLQQYIKQVQQLQNDLAANKELTLFQQTQMTSLCQQNDQLFQQKAELNTQITLLNNQIAKYKQKIKQLNQNAQNSTIQDIQDVSSMLLGPQLNTDMFQMKYFELQKVHQKTLQKAMQVETSYSVLKNHAGVYMNNLVEAMPDSYKTKLYPQVMSILIRLKCTNDKLYLLFDCCCTTLKQKQDVNERQKQSQVISEWLVLLIDQIPIIYCLLLRIELSLIKADTQQQLNEVISHYVLKEQIGKIDRLATQLLTRITSMSVDVSADLSSFIDPIQNLDSICLQLRKLSPQANTKVQLCTKLMFCIHKTFECVYQFKSKSVEGTVIQVDPLLENFVKTMIVYLRECCWNPHLRMKAEMKDVLTGLDYVCEILKEVQLNQGLHELSNLYSDTEDIRLLKDTIITTQFRIKELIADLQNVVLPNIFSIVQTKMSGKVWQDRVKQIKEELGKFDQNVKDKEEMQKVNGELRTRIAILEKEIKDRQSVKEMHEKRIGELQIKVDQAVLMEAEFKRVTEKVKTLEETISYLQSEMQLQNKKKKQLQEEMKKNKEKYDAFHTDNFLMQKKMKTSPQMFSEDITNLTIFKSLTKEASSLRHNNLKKKLFLIKQSPILMKEKVVDQNVEKAMKIRRRLLQQIATLDINKGSNEQIIKLISQERELQYAKRPIQAYKQIEIGCLSIGETTNGTINQSRMSIVSY